MTGPADRPPRAFAASSTDFAGRFRIRSLLGVGGSATVYRAEDLTRPDSPVALKVLHPQLCRTEQAQQAFLREAERIARLDHPNLARVHACGVDTAAGVSLPWIALDLVEGPTLAEWVHSHGPLAPQAATAVMTGLLYGLQAAHAAGLAHRDVSPGNVLLEISANTAPAADQVRLIDFGLADIAGHSALGHDLLLSQRSEQSEAKVVGSLHYLSPEQIRGAAVGPAGDIYQAGAVLYFCLTGQPPFPRGRAEQVVSAHLSSPPPPPSAVAVGARALDRIVITALAKDPADRFTDTAEFLAALADAAGGDILPARTQVLPAPTALALPRSTRPPSDYTGSLDYLSPASPPVPASPPKTRSPAAPIAVAILAAVAVLAAMTTFTSPPSAARPGNLASSWTAAPSPAAPSSPAVSPTPSAPVTTVAVPQLSGQLSEAETALTALGLRIGKVTSQTSAYPADVVLRQSPKPGSQRRLGSAVDVVIASGLNRVPEVAGLNQQAAAEALRSAGFEPVSAAHPEQIISTTVPAAGAVLTVGTRVRLVGISATPSPLPTASPTSEG